MTDAGPVRLGKVRAQVRKGNIAVGVVVGGGRSCVITWDMYVH